jgi:hypothetical protein
VLDPECTADHQLHHGSVLWHLPDDQLDQLGDRVRE